MSGPPAPAPRRPVPRGMLRIGTIAGSDVLVSTSWFLVAALIAWLMGPRVDQVQPGLGGWKYAVGVAFAIALYLAILLHEGSHALMARRFGFRVEAITLHFLGGATEISGEARRPRQEFWIAVVGPLTSIGVGVAALAVWFVLPDGLLRLVVEGLAGSNLIIGVLNLVPGLPLDGGRVLKAGVWAATGKVHAATVVAAWGGRATALAVVAWAVLSLDDGSVVSPVLLGIVAVFLWVGAGQSLASARVLQGLSEVVARDLARRALTVAPDVPLAEALRRATEAEAGGIVTVAPDGRPLGVVDERAATALPDERRPWVPVSAVARSITPGLLLPVGISGDDLIATLRQSPASEYVLVTDHGTVHGVLAASDVARTLRRGR